MKDNKKEYGYKNVTPKKCCLKCKWSHNMPSIAARNPHCPTVGGCIHPLGWCKKFKKK